MKSVGLRLLESFCGDAEHETQQIISKSDARDGVCQALQSAIDHGLLPPKPLGFWSVFLVLGLQTSGL